MTAGAAMLELNDIQYIVLARAPALTGRYEFLSFRNAAAGRRWLSAMLDRVHSVKHMRGALEEDQSWISLAFTWDGLRALGLDEASLASFPEEFKQGMASRADILGDAGTHHPDNWVGELGRGKVHAIAVLFARDAAERERCAGAHRALIEDADGVEVLSFLDLDATPPFEYAHDHFGYRDRMSQPVVEGSGDEPTPGSGAPLKPGEFILGYADEAGPPAHLPQPAELVRNGTYMAYRRLEEHVGRFRDFLARARQDARGRRAARREAHGPLAQRRSARLTVPTRTIPRWALTRNATTTSTTRTRTRSATPCRSARICRRMNPRDTAANMNRRRMIRRGGTYGTALTGGRARRRRRTRHRRIRHLRQPRAAVRIRAERLDQRPQFPRARQRA